MMTTIPPNRSSNNVRPRERMSVGSVLRSDYSKTEVRMHSSLSHSSRTFLLASINEQIVRGTGKIVAFPYGFDFFPSQ